MTKRFVYTAALFAAGAAGVAAMIHARNGAQPAGPAEAPALNTGASVISAAGRVEPVSEEVKIGSQLPGTLRETVEEGQRLRKGQQISTLDNGEYVARVEAARATIEVRQAELDRIVNGARDQERREAAAAVEEAHAVVKCVDGLTVRLPCLLLLRWLLELAGDARERSAPDA